MKNLFRGHYPPSKKEFEELWSKGLLVLDTNSLLNLFRYSSGTRDELLELLRRYQDRLWLPHQVGLEFHRHRRAVPGAQSKVFDTVEKAIDGAESEVIQKLGLLGRHLPDESAVLKDAARASFKELRDQLQEAVKEHQDAVLSAQSHDRTFDTVSDLYDGKVGLPYDPEELKRRHKEADGRYAILQPPGYEDVKDKDGEEKYGDYVLWSQILDHAADKSLPVIFVTNDVKEDWWERVGGKTIGPRPELIEEFYTRVGHRVHFYDTRLFLKYANQRLPKTDQVSEKAVREAGNVGRQLTESVKREHERRRLEYERTVRLLDSTRPFKTGSHEMRDLLGSVSGSEALHLRALGIDALGRQALGLPWEGTGLGVKDYLAVKDLLPADTPPHVIYKLLTEADQRRNAVAEAIAALDDVVAEEESPSQSRSGDDPDESAEL